MDNITAIAKTTYSRHAKSLALYILWGLLIILIALANRYNVLSIGRGQILLVDMGLVLLSLVGGGSVLILGFEVPREIRQREAENLLSKPVGRDQYLLGKFFGTLLFAFSNVIIVGIGFCIVVKFSEGKLPPEMFVPIIGVLGMVLMLAAVGALFGAFLGEVPAVVATFLIFWLGHSTQIVRQLADQSGSGLRFVLQAIYGVLPNLNLLNTRTNTSQTLFASAPSVNWGFAAEGFGYALLYSVVILAAALLVFRQRDL
jgi:ABC-type transport system involved in multi-copper enzyme maturation permease subunit